MDTPRALQQRIDRYCAKLENHPKLQSMYRKCAVSTVSSVLRPCEDGTWFVLTGDIPAMWLRDSAAQVNHYLPLADDPEMGGILEGVIRRQLQYIALDPYANAFNQGPTDAGTDLLHEGFCVDDPTRFTREWFTWPCSLFAEFIEHCVDEGVL